MQIPLITNQTTQGSKISILAPCDEIKQLESPQLPRNRCDQYGNPIVKKGNKKHRISWAKNLLQQTSEDRLNEEKSSKCCAVF